MKNFLLFALLLLSLPSISQDKPLDFYLVANANLYFSGISSEKEVYPILGYNKDVDPKVLVGGFGIGGLVYKPIFGKFEAKGQINFTKHTYWEASQTLTDHSGSPIDIYYYGTSD